MKRKNGEEEREGTKKKDPAKCLTRKKMAGHLGHYGWTYFSTLFALNSVISALYSVALAVMHFATDDASIKTSSEEDLGMFLFLFSIIYNNVVPETTVFPWGKVCSAISFLGTCLSHD